MKRLISFMLLSLLLFFTVFAMGCSKAPQPEIRRAELTDSEQKLLAAAGVSEYYVFDIDLAGGDFTGLKSWVEYYENGTLAKKEYGIELTSPSTNFRESNKRLVITLREGASQAREYEYYVSITYKGGMDGGRKASIPKPEFTTSSTGSAERQIIEPNKPIILVVSLFDKDGAIPEFITDDTYTGREDEIERILQSDYVYLFYCQFDKPEE